MLPTNTNTLSSSKNEAIHAEVHISAPKKRVRTEYKRAWRQQNREHIREYLNQWRAEHPGYDREWFRKWREENREALLEQKRQWREENRDAIAEYQRRYREAHPEKGDMWSPWADNHPERYALCRSVRHIVGRAIKNGVLVRPNECSNCGKPGRVDAAHYDYSRPLDVRWLCRSCHTSWDRREPKTLSAVVS